MWFGYSFADSFFTERYIPSRIADDYVRSSVQEADLSLRAMQLEERNLMLVHGTADKMVHQQHAMTFARELINKDIGFRQQVSECGCGRAGIY